MELASRFISAKQGCQNCSTKYKDGCSISMVVVTQVTVCVTDSACSNSYR